MRMTTVCLLAYQGSDPSGATIYPSPGSRLAPDFAVAVIGAGGTATTEYFNDVSGTTLASFYATRAEVVEAGLTRSFTDTPLARMGDAPLRLRTGQAWAIRWQLWLTVPVAGTYTFAVYADDGFSFNGNGLLFSNGTTRAATTTEASSGIVLTPGNVYNFALAYFNYTTATVGNIQLLWRRSGGALEIVPREAIHARGRRDYYSFGGAVVAMKEGVMSSATRTLTYLHGDHLGSASLTTNISGTVVSQQRYKPYGEVRWSSGAGMPTDLTFTGQRAGTAGYVGSLTDYVARFYSPVLGRFISADTIVPGAANPAAFNRYMYVLGNPLRFTDPTGKFTSDEVKANLVNQYGADLADSYMNAWKSDVAFWKMLMDANYGDVLFAPTTKLGSGKFTQVGGTFGFESESSLERYQGFGPYQLQNRNGGVRGGYGTVPQNLTLHSSDDTPATLIQPYTAMALDAHRRGYRTTAAFRTDKQVQVRALSRPQATPPGGW